jgi:hypothetical protein
MSAGWRRGGEIIRQAPARIRAVFGRLACDSSGDPLAAMAGMRYVERAERSCDRVTTDEPLERVAIIPGRP